MPYISRDSQGRIASLVRETATEQAEFMRADDPELQAFLGDSTGDGFDRLDADFVRVIEDVIDTLIVKNDINITDLPEQAQAKLMARRSFRQRITRHSLRLFDNSGMAEVIGGHPAPSAPDGNDLTG